MEPIRLGAIYNLTGGQADLDVPSLRGAQLAIDGINARGGLLGRPVELIVVDGATDPATLAEQTTAVIMEHPQVSALFGLSDTDMVLAAASSCATEGRLFVTSGATSPRLPQQVPTYLYLACFGDNVQAAVAAEYAYDQLRARSALVVYRREDTFTELLQGYFVSRFKEMGGKVVDGLAYTALEDLALTGAAIRSADVVYFAAAPDDVIPGLSRLRGAGITVPILGGDSFDLGPVWENQRDLTGVTFTTHALVSPANPDPAMAVFIGDYERAYPSDEAGAFAALGYDTARLICHTITLAGSARPTAVAESLAGVRDFAGLTGTISYDDGRRVPTKSVTMLAIENGRTRLVGQFTPRAVPEP